MLDKGRRMCYNRGMPQKSGRFYYGYVILLCCCLIMAVNAGIAMSCAGVFYLPVSQELGVSVGRFGWYMSFNFLASTLMLSVAGRLMERWGARRMLSISSGLMGGCLLSMSLFTALWQFYAAGALMGVSLAFLYYLSFPTLVNSWFRRRVGLYMGICSASMGVGGAVFNPLCGLLIQEYGWRVAYGVLGGGVLLVLTPLLALLLRNAPAEPQAAAPGGGEAAAAAALPAEPEGISHEQALRMPVFYVLVVYAFLINATAPICLFMPSYVTPLSSAEQGALVAAAVMLGVATGKVALGVINDKSHALGVVVSTLSGVAGLLLLAQGPPSVFVAGAFLFGWAFAGVSVQTPLLVRAVFGSRCYTRIYAGVSIALAAGGTLAAGGWGALAEATSYHTAFGVAVGFLVVCLGLGLVALRHRGEAAARG